MILDPLCAYSTYVALKNHFTSDSYDYFKYQKKSNVSSKSLDKRSDKYFFFRLAKKGDTVEDFLVANLIENPNIWVGELLSDKGEVTYKDWKRKRESLSYAFKEEIEFFNGLVPKDLDEMFAVKSGEHPVIIKKYFQKEISLETLIILNELLTFMKKYDTIINDPLYNEVSRMCKKYRPFMDIDTSKCKSIIKSVMGL